MKLVKYGAIALVAYAGLVLAFESLIGYFQPADETTMVLSVERSDGGRGDWVLSRLESDGRVYVASNHWFRGWYHEALANPDVEATFDGRQETFRVVSVTDPEEFARVDGEFPLGAFRVLMGFAPRYLVRLDPR